MNSKKSLPQSLKQKEQAEFYFLYSNKNDKNKVISRAGSIPTVKFAEMKISNTDKSNT